MAILSGKKVVVGVTGGVAAYKAPELVRELKRQGADVRVAMTPNAKQFITPLTLQAVSGHLVAEQVAEQHDYHGMGHIALARWADAIVIAPATADTMATLAIGRAHHIVSAICLATRAPVWIAPSMNTKMWHHPATQRNQQALLDDGYRLLGPDKGDLACGETGAGRLVSVAAIAHELASFFSPSTRPLMGKHVLITAGPTQEPIDPVRYLTNRSSGRMGYAMAQAAQKLGAQVTLVTGPTHLSLPEQVSSVSVNTAKEMHDAVMSRVDDAHIFIGVAAVSDYSVETVSLQKIKKTSQAELLLPLTTTPDIIKAVAERAKKTGGMVIGFAAETQDIDKHALKKCREKGVDLVIANDVSRGQCFDQRAQAVSIYDTEGLVQAFSLTEKSKLSMSLMTLIVEYYNNTVLTAMG